MSWSVFHSTIYGKKITTNSIYFFYWIICQQSCCSNPKQSTHAAGTFNFGWFGNYSQLGYY